MDPDPHSLNLLDPDTIGEKMKNNNIKYTGKWLLLITVFLILSKFGPAPWVFTLEQSFFSSSSPENSLQGNLLLIFLSWIRIRIEKNQLVPDPQKINTDPQPGLLVIF